MDNNKLDELEKRMTALESQLNALNPAHTIPAPQKTENSMVVIVCTQDLDKILPALVLASSAVSMGIKVTFFFTIWGLNAIKKGRVLSNKKATQKLMSLLTPQSFDHLPISNLNILGIGPQLLKYMIKERKLSSPSELMKVCLEEGVEFTACEMTMNILGIKKEELLDNVTVQGAAAVISLATASKVTLFI